MILLLWILIPAVAGTILPVDDSVPFLATQGSPIDWTRGKDALLLAGSSFVRVNRRGITLKPPHWTMRDLGTMGWDVRACIPGGHSLCESGNTSRVFPVDTPPRFAARHRPHALRCTRADSKRILDHDATYDVSSCDVLDGGGDVVVYQHRVAFRDTQISNIKYWLLCILAVVVVRSFSWKITTQMEQKNPGSTLQNDQWTILACAASILLSITPNFTEELVTYEDLFCCSFLVIYSAIYIGVWVLNRHDKKAPIYNLIAATLQLTSSRLYKGIETPYAGVLLYVIITRMLIKIRGQWNFIQAVTSAWDSLLITIIAIFGFPFDQIYVLVVAVAAFATADLLAQPSHPPQETRQNP